MRVDVLVAEIGSTTTVVNAFKDIDSADPVFWGQGQAPTSVLEGDVRVGLQGAIDDLFIQESAYYLCGVSDQPLCPRLSGCEVDEAFALCWIDPETAIAANRQHPHGALSGQEWAAHLFQRDALLIRKLQEERLL